MPHAIIRGKNGRRHEVDFGDAPVRVEVYSSEETVEIFVEADLETLPEERLRFSILNIPRHQFSAEPDMQICRIRLSGMRRALQSRPGVSAPYRATISMGSGST